MIELPSLAELAQAAMGGGYGAKALYPALLAAASRPLRRAGDPFVGSFDGPAELPRALVDFTEPTIGEVATVKASEGDFTTLQAAYDWFTSNGRSDHTAIQIDAGYDCGPLDCVSDAAQSGSNIYWLVIRTANYASLPRHVRVGPGDKSDMGQMTQPTSAYSLWLGANTQRVRFVGISSEMDAESDDGSSAGGSKTDLGADHIIWDRCLIRGGDLTYYTSRGIWMQGTHMGIIDCHIDDVVRPGFDTQAILMGNGAGPYTIVNNNLQGGGENIMCGGYDSSSADDLPQDITIARNYISKDTAWPDNAIKNSFELKSAVRVLFENNICQDDWDGAQESTINIKSVNQGGGIGEWSKTTDVTVRRSKLTNFHSGIALASNPEGIVAEELSRVSIHDLEFISGGFNNPNYQANDTTPFAIQILGKIKDLTFRNTSFDGDFYFQVIHEDGENDKVNFFFDDNILDDSDYGFQNAGNLEAMIDNWTVSGNIFAPLDIGTNAPLSGTNCIDAYPPQGGCPDAGHTTSPDAAVTGGDFSGNPWSS